LFTLTFGFFSGATGFLGITIGLLGTVGGGGNDVIKSYPALPVFFEPDLFLLMTGVSTLVGLGGLRLSLMCDAWQLVHHQRVGYSTIRVLTLHHSHLGIDVFKNGAFLLCPGSALQILILLSSRPTNLAGA